MHSETRYAQSADGMTIAYQVLGNGPRDLVLVPGWIFHLEIIWEQPAFERFMRRLLRSFRVIMFDKRGTGLSDRSVGASSVEERMRDVVAVMDAARSNSACLMGWSEGGNIAAFFAATYPERTDALVLYAASARYARTPDYPFGLSDDFIETSRDVIANRWGQGLTAYVAAPSRADDESFRRWFGRFERLTVSPGEGLAMMELNLELDTTEMMRHVRVPTLVMHNLGDRFVPVDSSRYIADQVPDSKLVELPGDDHLFWFSNSDEVVGELEDFLLGVRAEDDPERVLATVLFTDIVGSTARAQQLGDKHWRELLEVHDRVAGETLAHFNGRMVKTTGDGILAIFDGPARAARCALRLQEQLERTGLPIRAGLHTGEIEIRGDDVGGVAVHIAARVSGLAESGEVLVSRTVKELSVGSRISFADKGERELKGLEDPVQLYAASA